MRIYPKIMSGFMATAGIILVMQVGNIVFNTTTLQEMRRHIAGLGGESEPATQLALQLQRTASNVRELLLESMAPGERVNAQETKRATVSIKDGLLEMNQLLQVWQKNTQAEILDKQPGEEEELANLLPLEQKNQRFRELSEQFLGRIEEGEFRSAHDLWTNTMEPLFRELQDEIARLYAATVQEAHGEAEEIFRHITQAIWINMATIVVGLLASILVSLFLAKKLVSPILQFKKTLQTIQAQKKYERVELSAKDEIGDLAEAFNQLTQQLELSQSQVIQSSKLASVGELAAGIAHELNQPLMVMRSKNQLLHRRLQKESITPEQIAEAIEMVDRNTKRMMNIINHLRAFSRQAEQAQDLVQINQVIDDCFLLIGEQLRLRDIQIKKEFDPGLPRIKADGNRLEQVFLNLLGNARDAVVEKREKSVDKEKYQAEIDIHTGMSEDRSHIVILISDNGCGIPPLLSQTLFDPFVTSKEVGKGTGLGLSISYGIIQEHRGQIRVAQSGPEGTTFCVELPVR